MTHLRFRYAQLGVVGIADIPVSCYASSHFFATLKSPYFGAKAPRPYDLSGLRDALFVDVSQLTSNHELTRITTTPQHQGCVCNR